MILEKYKKYFYFQESIILRKIQEIWFHLNDVVYIKIIIYI